MTDLPTITAALRWDGDRLMLGKIVVGSVQKRPGSWEWWSVNDGNFRWQIARTRKETRAALAEAAVRAVGGET